MKKLDKLALLVGWSVIPLMAADYLSATDHLFAKLAAQAGMAQMKFGQLAVSRGSSQKVKEFGQRLINENQTIDRLKSIAAKDNILLPSSPSARDLATLNRLSSLTGPAFDKAYFDSVAKERGTAIELFQNEAGEGSNRDLKGLASSTLPGLREQLARARDAAGSVVTPAAR